MEIVYKYLQITDFRQIYFGGFPPQEIEEGGSGGIPESEGRGGSPNPSLAEKSEKFQKNLSKFGRFRLSAPYINT